MVAAIGGVYAQTLGVPFFADASTAPDGADGAPATFVALNNTTTGVITITLTYFASDGTQLNPPPTLTANIDPGASIAFRPVSDVGEPGVVPNRPTTDGKKNGSLRITWSGAATDINGRALILQGNQQSAFLLPSGS